jgi:hypothetical protein
VHADIAHGDRIGTGLADGGHAETFFARDVAQVTVGVADPQVAAAAGIAAARPVIGEHRADRGEVVLDREDGDEQDGMRRDEIALGDGRAGNRDGQQARRKERSEHGNPPVWTAIAWDRCGQRGHSPK